MRRSSARRAERAARWLLREGLTSALFAPAMRVGQALRPLLPGLLKDKVPHRRTADSGRRDPSSHPRKVLLLQGCVQPSMMPNVDRAAARVLGAAGIQTLHASGAGCCGALRTHLGDHEGGLEDMRRNIDAWMPHRIDGRGGGDHLLPRRPAAWRSRNTGMPCRGDDSYCGKAARISALARDLSELLPQLVPALQGRMRLDRSRAACISLPLHAATRPAITRRNRSASAGAWIPGRSRGS